MIKSALFLGKPSISLTGFMFTGKSSAGRALARKLELKYIDLDAEIQKAEGASIESIFAERGEPEFRRLEREAVARIIPLSGQVVATGGGVVIDPENRKLMARHSCIIWLRASAGTILERWRRSRGKVRPLLSVADPRKEIIRLLEERNSYYRECDFSVDTDRLTVKEVCESIIKKLSS
ncbi:MAG TPA: shikimate kinase [archaeon]|nr:shikimate kinase [archaeon]